ncbi:hypothetical protein DPX16_3279 [Anabarilius grahami]|uniref:Uncharacterized protein n=1 Tax=Anabarilius grahami TaxID=495550 RepID=A0A3N0XPK0_ANAGA|nr:hypothetical protein DPX16_3279 [Anabarilius grahami]
MGHRHSGIHRNFPGTGIAIGVARWNFQCLVDLKQPGVKLPAVFDPVLIMELNKLSDMVTGQAKYPALLISQTDTRERFGLLYVEPGCRPVPLDWDKHKFQKVPVAGEGEHQSSEPSALSERFPPDDPPEEVREEHFAQPMRDSIDGLQAKHHGQKDRLSQEDAEYAALVQAASKDPNILLYPTTKQHISRYVKYLAKMMNTSSSLNTSSEKLLETLTCRLLTLPKHLFLIESYRPQSSVLQRQDR